MPPLAVSSGPARASILSLFLGFAVTLTPQSASAWSVSAPEDVQLRSITSDRLGCPLVGGVRLRGGASTVYAAKYRVDGSLAWSTDSSTDPQIAGEVLETAVDSAGDLYVTGTEMLEGGRTGLFAAHFSGTDGHLRWRSSVTTPDLTSALTEGSGETLSIGSKGQVIVGGSARTASRALGVVCRLSPVDGATQWCWTGDDLVVRDTAVDRTGDVLATGTFFLAVKLDGTDGAEEWRTTLPGTAAQELGYPQMLTLALDKSGNVTVGGSLRNTFDDTRAFYASALSARTGQPLWENAGAPLYSFEAPARLLTFGSYLLAAGRQNGSPVVMDLQARTGRLRWRMVPWSVDDYADQALGVADLATDGKCAYALGTDFPGRLLLTTVTSAGKSRWQRDLGQGQGVQLVVTTKKRLFAIARRAGIDGLDWQYAVVGLDAASGRDL